MAAPVLTIDDVQLPVEIAKGAVGGPMFSTIVASGKSAAEKRIAQWVVGRRRWDVPFSRRDAAQANALVSFFYGRRGRLRGFRFQDPEDYKATAEVLYPTGASTVQLERTYTSGAVASRRKIYKPVQSVGVTLTRNGSAFTMFSVDYTSGMIYLTADITKAITGITQASGAVISCTAHPFSIGDELYMSGVAGMTQINGQVVTITATSANTFTVSLNTTAYSAYTSGGLAHKYVQSDETLLWTGQFDIPARFDTDACLVTQADRDLRDWDSVPIVELLQVPTPNPVAPPAVLELVAQALADGATAIYAFSESAGVLINQHTPGTFDLSVHANVTRPVGAVGAPDYLGYDFNPAAEATALFGHIEGLRPNCGFTNFTCEFVGKFPSPQASGRYGIELRRSGGLTSASMQQNTAGDILCAVLSSGNPNNSNIIANGAAGEHTPFAHYVWRWDGQTHTGYRNNVQKYSVAVGGGGAALTEGAPFQLAIGGIYGAGNGNIDGIMAFVAIYPNVHLSTTQIATHHIASGV